MKSYQLDEYIRGRAGGQFSSITTDEGTIRGQVAPDAYSKRTGNFVFKKDSMIVLRGEPHSNC